MTNRGETLQLARMGPHSHQRGGKRLTVTAPGTHSTAAAGHRAIGRLIQLVWSSYGSSGAATRSTLYAFSAPYAHSAGDMRLMNGTPSSRLA